jgi:mannose-6-phosphate isomerase-like protein (cupin superfamily)
MNEMTRRDLCLALPSLGLLGSAIMEAQTTQPAAAQTSSSADTVLTHSAAYSFDSLPVHNGANGMVSRAVTRGKLPTGESVELHETTLMPGQMPHPPHKHVHSEFMMFREGTLEFTAEGKSTQVGPGGVVYAASNEMHSLKNVGTVPANYFVIAIGMQNSHG